MPPFSANVLRLRRRDLISNATAAALLKGKKKITPKLKDDDEGLDQGQSVASTTNIPFLPQTTQDKTRCTPLPT